MKNFRILAIFLLLLGLGKGMGQEECKETTFSEASYCQSIETWEELLLWVEDSVPGDELYFCPFDIDKADAPPLDIEWGLSIICVQNDESDSCIIRGSGIIINIVTSGDVLLQSLSFEGGDDHAVHISSVIDGDSSQTTTTLCHCSFNGYVL